MEIQRQEVLSLRDALCCSTHPSIRWRHCKILRPTRDFLQMHLQEQDFFGSQVTHFKETRLVILRLLREISTRKSTSKSGTGKDFLSRHLRSLAKSTFKRLCKQTPLWLVITRKSLRNPEEWKEYKKGTLSDQPWLTGVTPTALLGSWVLQPIEGMTSIGTDFKKHAKWQGYVEEPAAKDFVARKVCTIKWNEVQGTSWNGIKCKERLRSCPEAVVRQATSNLDSQVWKSLWDSFPELYCVDLAEAYVMQESVSSRIYMRRKGMICDPLMDVCMRNLWQKAGWGENADGTNSCTRFPRASYFEKTRNVCQIYRGACTTWYSEYKRYKNGMRNQSPAQPRKVQRN